MSFERQFKAPNAKRARKSECVSVGHLGFERATWAVPMTHGSRRARQARGPAQLEEVHR